jgi:hypothetical protein
MLLNLPSWLPFCNSALSRLVRLLGKADRFAQSIQAGRHSTGRWFFSLTLPNDTLNQDRRFLQVQAHLTACRDRLALGDGAKDGKVALEYPGCHLGYKDLIEPADWNCVVMVPACIKRVLLAALMCAAVDRARVSAGAS